jgi:CubicO group peptidase (beta-lactamase class C family)
MMDGRRFTAAVCALLISSGLAIGDWRLALAFPHQSEIGNQEPRTNRAAPIFPGATWETRTPEQVGLSKARLEELARLVQGRGCVVRHGYMVHAWGEQAKSGDIASAVKPVISTLLLFAVQEGKLKSVDDPVAEFEPRLRTINGGKDAGITWRHLASQTSGYGLVEAPGKAYSYNDFALALYYDVLTEKVLQEPGTQALKSRLGHTLQFEDPYRFRETGPNSRGGRLEISCRDLARFGLFYLHDGRWRGRQVLRPDLVKLAVSSPIPGDLPRTSGQEADMLPGQRSLGGTRNITPAGPGFYSFNWWLNRMDAKDRRLFVDAPVDAYVAAGHGGKRMLWIIPSLDLIVCWNDSPIDDHDASPGNPNTRCNQAARLMRQAVSGNTRIQTQGTQFTLNGQPKFLLGISYYGALGAPEETLHQDLAEIKERGFNWIRVWANWGAFGADAAAVDVEGRPRPPQLKRLRDLVAMCDRLGIVVDVSLSRGNGVAGPPRLQSHEAHQRAVETLVKELESHRNWYLDLSNERNIKDKRFTSFQELARLRERVRQLDSGRLVTASHAGDIAAADLKEYVDAVKVDFLSPHRPRNAQSPGQTADKTRAYLEQMKALGRPLPVHYQEPFRRGFGKFEPKAEDFLVDLQNARSGGAAGWCLHNGDQRRQPDGRPRRSFDLRHQRLFEQLDTEEMKFLRLLGGK